MNHILKKVFFGLFLLVSQLTLGNKGQVKNHHSYLYFKNWSGNWQVPDSTNIFDQAIIKLPFQPLHPFFAFSSNQRADIYINHNLVLKGKHKQATRLNYPLAEADSLVFIQFYKSTSMASFKAELSLAPIKTELSGFQVKKPILSMLGWACLAVIVLSCLARIYDHNLFFDMFNFTKPLTKESQADFLDLFTGRLPPIFLGLIFTQAFAGLAAIMLCFPDSWLVLNRYVLIENDTTEWFAVLGASALIIFGIYIWIMIISFLFGQKEKFRFLSLNLEIKIFYSFSLLFSFILLVNELNKVFPDSVFADYVHKLFLGFLLIKAILTIKAFSNLKPGITAVRICYICTANLVPLFVIFQYLKAH